jgi:hypothetical protein
MSPCSLNPPALLEKGPVFLLRARKVKAHHISSDTAMLRKKTSGAGFHGGSYVRDLQKIQDKTRDLRPRQGGHSH